MEALKLFSVLYDKTLLWSSHKHASYYLAAVAFAESSFFPIPPDVMLLSMGLARPNSAWRNAAITTVFSVIGGMFGYLIGLWGMGLIEPLIQGTDYQESYHHISHWFNEHGVWIILLAGFTPLPYKLFTITAGALVMPFLPFVLCSIIGRGLRFYLVSTLMYFFGDKIQGHLRQYIDAIGWSLLVIFVMVYLFIRWNA